MSSESAASTRVGDGENCPSACMVPPRRKSGRGWGMGDGHVDTDEVDRGRFGPHASAAVLTVVVEDEPLAKWPGHLKLSPANSVTSPSCPTIRITSDWSGCLYQCPCLAW
jgi:hypothetical protein